MQFEYSENTPKVRSIDKAMYPGTMLELQQHGEDREDGRDFEKKRQREVKYFKREWRTGQQKMKRMVCLKQ